MSYPVLYGSEETNFSTNGIGVLSDCIYCEVTEEANGAFELSMKYPADGIHFDKIESRSIIKAKPDQFRSPQLFRVYSKTKNSSNEATILAEHISYDLSGIVVSPFSASNAAEAISGFKSYAATNCPFEFWTDKDTEASFKVSVPSSIRSMIGGVSGSILDTYGGDLEFDNYLVKLYNNRGEDRGVSIRYGKNLTSFQQEENCASVATGVYPYWVDIETSEVFELTEKIVNAEGTYNFVKIKAVDFSYYFEEKPTEEQLRKKAKDYMKENEIGIPSVSMVVSFAALEQYDEYKGLALLERVSLFDTVSVFFPSLNVSAKAKAVKITYDVVLDRVKSVVLGSVRANIADTIATQKSEIAAAPTKSDLEKAKEAATAWLTNGKGYKVERRDALGNTIDTLYMDSPDIDTAVNVLRIGQSGIGFSNNGVNGPYISAWTVDGKFNADFITSGTINAALIKVINLDADSIRSGKISSQDGSLVFDLDNNTITSSEAKSAWKVKISEGYIFFEDPTNDARRIAIGREVHRPYDGAMVKFFDESGNSAGGVACVDGNLVIGTTSVENDDAVEWWTVKWRNLSTGSGFYTILDATEQVSFS